MTTTEKPLTKAEIEERIRALSDEEIDFIVNLNTHLANLGPRCFQTAVNMVGKALYILQKEGIMANIMNIGTIASKVGEPVFKINRAECICALYYLQQNVGTITMIMEANEMPRWEIREDIFSKLCLPPI